MLVLGGLFADIDGDGVPVPVGGRIQPMKLGSSSWRVYVVFVVVFVVDVVVVALLIVATR